MFETIESRLINDWLKTQNKVPLLAAPLFRLIWSNDCTQLRREIVNDGMDHEFFTGKVIKEIKYPWITNRWLLEQWISPEFSATPALPDTYNGSYEVLYVFEDKNRNALPLNQKVVELIVYRMNHPSSPMAIKSRLIAEQEEWEKNDDLDIDRYFDTSSDIMTQFRHGEAIIVPSNYNDLIVVPKEMKN